MQFRRLPWLLQYRTLFHPRTTYLRSGILASHTKFTSHRWHTISSLPKVDSPTPDTNHQPPEKEPELSGIVEDHEYVAYVVAQRKKARNRLEDNKLPPEWWASKLAESNSWKQSFDNIKSTLDCWYLNPGAPWGFVVYRTVYGKESDELWTRMLEQIRNAVAETLSLENAREPEKLLQHFELTVMEDEKRFAGADSHSIRQVFHEWVAEDLPPRLREPDKYVILYDEGGINHPWYFAPPRWNFCLLVDEICLQSMDHPRRRGTVVKLVHTAFPGGECEDIAEEWEDGETDDPSEDDIAVEWEDGETDDPWEDVGWTYIYASEHVDWYERLQRAHDWHEWYERPLKRDCPYGAGDMQV